MLYINKPISSLWEPEVKILSCEMGLVLLPFTDISVGIEHTKPVTAGQGRVLCEGCRIAITHWINMFYCKTYSYFLVFLLCSTLLWMFFVGSSLVVALSRLHGLFLIADCFWCLSNGAQCQNWGGWSSVGRVDCPVTVRLAVRSHIWTVILSPVGLVLPCMAAAAHWCVNGCMRDQCKALWGHYDDV